MELAEFFGKVELFAELSEQALQHLARVFTTEKLAAGKVLFYAGDPADSLYVIQTGQLEAYLTDADTGVDISLKRFGVTEYVGEMALISGAPRSASVRAVVDTELLALTRENLLTIVERVPSVSIALAKELARRLRDINETKGVAFVDLSRYRFDPEAWRSVPRRLLEVHKAIPLRRTDHALTVAMITPSDMVAIDDLRQGSGGLVIEPLAITEQDYERFLTRHRDRIGGEGAKAPAFEKKVIPLRYLSTGDVDMDLEARRRREVPGQRVHEALDTLLNDAFALEASDIHLEPKRECMEVRFRVDGVLQRREPTLPLEMLAPLTSRIKVLAGMDISEKRMPQDGRFAVVRGGARIDLRAATMPSSFGETLVLRVLDPAMLMHGVDRIVLAARVCEMVRNMIREPHGLVLVSGPTGAGKTTTLYSMINEIDRESLNVVTAEDPIEYEIQDVTQTQVHVDAGLDFPALVRSMLRQDPDVMFIGEVRDPITAKAATESALTGHLVLTSVHTNDAVGSIARLRELGVEPFLVANSLVGVLNQRLVRRICAACKQAEPLEDALTTRLVAALGHDIRVERNFRGRGCERCGGTGYRGRVAVYEVLRVSAELRELMVRDASPSALREAAMSAGMVPLRAYAGFLLNAGLTSAVEILRILHVDA